MINSYDKKIAFALGYYDGRNGLPEKYPLNPIEAHEYGQGYTAGQNDIEAE